MEPAPIGHRVREELRTVIEAQTVWRTVYKREAVQHIDEAAGVDGSVADSANNFDRLEQN